MARLPASLMCGGVGKSGCPISRWMMLLPCASSARARARTSNADSVPIRDMRSASFMDEGLREIVGGVAWFPLDVTADAGALVGRRRLSGQYGITRAA